MLIHSLYQTKYIVSVYLTLSGWIKTTKTLLWHFIPDLPTIYFDRLLCPEDECISAHIKLYVKIHIILHNNKMPWKRNYQ